MEFLHTKIAAAHAFTNFEQLLLKNLLIVSQNKPRLDCWQSVDPLEPSFEVIWLFIYLEAILIVYRLIFFILGCVI